MSDNTATTVARQLKCLASETYEIGIYDRQNDKMTLRTYTVDSVLKSLRFLKYKNKNGFDIFIRPKGPSGYIFVDDISVTDIARMEKDGYLFSVVVESSPLNYQGWLKFSSAPIDPETASIVGRYLARKYGADMRSSDWRHFGRLAGFTNRKPGYVNEIGHYPYVGIYSTSTAACTNSCETIQQALLEHEKTVPEPPKRSIPSCSRIDNPMDVYSWEISKNKRLWGARYNSSDADWQAVLRMIEVGCTADQIKDVLFESSESVAKRSTTRALDYVDRTVRNALKLFPELPRSPSV